VSDLTRSDKLGDEDVKPKRVLTDYERGYLDGLITFAWHDRDEPGVLKVGTTGTTLRRAMRDFMDEIGA
jgi:hypothetical protein